MNNPYFFNELALLLAASLLIVLVCIQLVKAARACERNARSLGKLILMLIAWSAIVGWVHTAYPRQHRLFFDEDVYANIAHNILAGYGATVTAASTEEGKVTQPYKWPIGFPTLALPAVVWSGIETGPSAFNEFCGALTLALVMAFATRLASSCLAGVAAACFYGLHPITGGWYRSGSAEPLAVLLLTLSLWAMIEHCSAMASENRGEMNLWLTISLLAALIAIHVRLENVLIAVPLLILLKGRKLAFSTWQWLILMLIGGPLLFYFVSHAINLGNYYMAGLQESTFSASYLFDNLFRNLKFMLDHALKPYLLLAAAGLIISVAIRQRIKPLVSARVWVALILWQAANAVVLLFYSVGQYGAPGGSRFLLAFLVLLSLIAAVALCQTGTGNFRLWIVAAGMIIYLVALPDPDRTWQTLDAQNASPRIEHEALKEWSAGIARPAVVISRTPYLWENFGALAMSPEHADSRQRMPASVLYFHKGLFDQSNAPGLSDELIVKKIMTDHGEIVLYRLP